MANDLGSNDRVEIPAEAIVSNGSLPTPSFFLEVRVHRLDLTPGLTGLCAGYELGEWRANQFASHLMEWLPEFALTEGELAALNSATAVRMMQQAARNIFTTEKYHKRGEFGELLLHVAIRQCFDSVPAISKIHYKDGPNETVKGFDAVHVIAGNQGLELWLGEVKFYDDISTAISHVIKELSDHTERDYLRDEFQAITRKVDDSWKHAEKLKKLIDINTTLDEVFGCACLAVLLTYDSPCLASFTEVSDDYKRQFEVELLRHYQTFVSKSLPKKVRVHLFLVPLRSKIELLSKLQERLKAWQSIM